MKENSIPPCKNEHFASQSEVFIKTPVDLMTIPGLSARLMMLYGRLRLHAGKDGSCHPLHATIAQELGIRDRTWVLRLLERLRELKLIEWERRGPHANQYRILQPDLEWITRQIAERKRIRKDVVSRPQLDVHCRPHLDVADRPHRKDSSSKEEVSKRGSTPPPPSPGSRIRTPTEPRKPNLKKTDDDEKPKTAAADPEAEFRRRTTERHGASFDAGAALGSVRRQLAPCGGLTLADFLAYDQAQTTGNHFSNPGGYYVALAKQLVRATRDQTLASLRRPHAQAEQAEPVRNQYGRCQVCGGPGVLPSGGFCTCQTGRDLAGLARRAARAG